MRDIAKLLFGEDTDRLLDLFSGGDGDGFGMADRVHRAGEWCGTTPGRDSAAAAAARGAARPHGMRGQVIIREFRSR
jgi:hypothetical protein